MKLKLLCAAMLAASVSVSCKYDDTEILDQIIDQGLRLEELEEWQESINDEVAALQSLVAALEGKDYITDVVEKDGSYTISFSNSEDITITDGKDGEDGATPVVGIKEVNGVYYWTLQVGDEETEFMTDANGNKVIATASTPEITIEKSGDKLYWKVDGEWVVDADGNKIPATGNSVFDDVVVSDDGYSITITPAGEDPFTLPIISGEPITTKEIGTNQVIYDIVYIQCDPDYETAKLHFKVDENIKFIAITAELVTNDITRASSKVAADKITLTKEVGSYVVTLKSSDSNKKIAADKQGVVKISLIDKSGMEISKNIIYVTYDTNTKISHRVIKNNGSVTQQINEEISSILESTSTSDTELGMNEIIIFDFDDDNIEVTEFDVDVSKLCIYSAGRKLTLDFGDYATAVGESISIYNTATTDVYYGTLSIIAPNAAIKLCNKKATYDFYSVSANTKAVEVDTDTTINNTLNINNRSNIVKVVNNGTITNLDTDEAAGEVSIDYEGNQPTNVPADGTFKEFKSK